MAKVKDVKSSKAKVEKETPKAYLKDGLYVPLRFFDKERREYIKDNLKTEFFKKEEVCEGCEYYTERVCDVCENCANYGGTVKYWNKVEINEKKYIRFPYGMRKRLPELIGSKPKIIDKTPDRPMKKKIKFTAKLRPDQEICVDAMVKARNGVLKSPPRSGKTVLSSAFACRLGQKTLVLAAQRDWLDGFYETFVGSDTQEPMTNASKKRIGFCKKLEDFEKYDVCFVTYQIFIRPSGKKLLTKIKNMFGVLLIDEVQTVGAKELAAVVSQLNVRYKIGVSGTPERKDTKEEIIYSLLGPVFHENKVEKLKPTVQLKVTGFGPQMPKLWTYIVRKIETDPKRLKLIAKEAIADVEKKHSVVIPFTRVPVIKALCDTINRLYGKTIAAPFYGGIPKAKRKETIELARKYKYKVIVGNTSLLSTGINIPRASMLYQVTPASNIPKAQQRFARVLTPMEGKPQPVIKYFLDEVEVVRRCMQKEHWQCMIPMFKPIISQKDREHLASYFKGKSSQRKHENYGNVL